MTITVAPAAPQDGAAILRMAGALAAHHGDAATLTAATLARDLFGPDPWCHALVARADGAAAGFAAFTRLCHLPAGRRGIEITSLWTDPDHRGRGIGSALVAACIDRARAQSCDLIAIGAHPDNHAAQAFHAARGFQRRDGSGIRFRMDL